MPGLNLRKFSDDLKRELKMIALEQRKTLNQLIIEILKTYTKKENDND